MVTTNGNNTDPLQSVPSRYLAARLTFGDRTVRREVASIENEALATVARNYRSALTGQPPTLQGTGMRANQLLGKLMNFDENMYALKNEGL